MKRVYFILIILIAFLQTKAQDKVDFLRTKVDGNRNIVDARLRLSHSLNIPKGASWSLNGAKDSIGYVMFNTTLQRFGVYHGSGVWKAYATIDEIELLLDGKVDTIHGKGLSTEDYTTSEKSKLAGIEAGAEVNVNADWSAVSGDAMILNKPTFVATESDPVFLAQKGVANGVASLNSSGKVPNAQIPALALVDTYVVGSQAAMLALSTAEQGDVAIRTDLSKTFILTDNNYSTLASWKELLSPVIPAEKDPIWGASPSAGITSTNITNWNTAYSSLSSFLPLTAGSGKALTGQLYGTTALFANTTNFSKANNSAAGFMIGDYSSASGSSLFVKTGSLSNSYASGLAVYGSYSGGLSMINIYGVGTNLNGGYASALNFMLDNNGTTRSHAYFATDGITYLYGPLNVDGPGVVSRINSTNSNTYKIVFQDNAVARSYIGASSNDLFTVADASVVNRFSISSDGYMNSIILGGGGDRILYTNNAGKIGALGIGSGVAIVGGNLTATGGTPGTISGSGTAGFLVKFTGSGSVGNSIITESGSTILLNGASATLRLGSNSGDHGLLTYTGGATVLDNNWASTSGYVRVRANGYNFDFQGTGNLVVPSYLGANSGFYSQATNTYMLPITTGWQVQSASASLSVYGFKTSDGVLRGYVGANNTGVVGGFLNTSSNFVVYADASGNWTIGGQFNGSGAGLTGTASSLTAGAANSVAWTNVSGRPTALSSFTNDAGYITSASGVLSKGNLLISGDGTTTVFSTGLSGGTVMVVSPSSVDAIGLTYYLYQSSGTWYIQFTTPPANFTTVRYYAIVS